MRRLVVIEGQARSGTERSAMIGADAVATLRFEGAVGEVTGSCHRLDVAGSSLIVDCGMFQGGRDADERNRDALAFDVASLHAVVLTHAHIDHSGLLPRLVARGYRGPIHATPATCDLLEVMLLDAAHIQEKDAEHRARRRDRGEAGDEGPLYTVEQARRALAQLRPQPLGRPFAVGASITVRFHEAGHILGSAIAEIRAQPDGAQGMTFVFTGDLGQPGRPVLPDPAPIASADVLVVESTYGDRLHKSLDATYDELAGILSTTLARGNVVIPAFAVGRTQELLHVLADLAKGGRVPPLNVFVDSPLATAATAITARYAPMLDRETRDLAAWQQGHPERMRLRFTETAQDSMALNAISSGAVIIAASGMCDAGRVRHHLRHNLGRESCAVVITGFQAQGTLGRALVDGARSVRLFREDVPVRASIHTVGGLSAHADQAALLGWLRRFRAAPSRTFVVHGEAGVARTFAERIRHDLGWTAVDVPSRGDAHSFPFDHA